VREFNLSEWALEHQSLVLFFMLALFAAGVFSYFRLGQAEDPDFTFKLMVVRAIWPGASPREMEEQVTERLEKKLQETPFLDNVRSYTKAGETTIFVTLGDSTAPKEVPDVWYQVRKKIGDMRNMLPNGVIGPFFNDEFGDVFGNIYAFTGDGYSYAELKDYIEQVRKEILRVPNVAKAEIVGDQDEKIYVEVSHRKLATLGIDPLSIFEVLRAQNAMTPAGSIDTRSDRMYLRISGSFDSVESIREIGIQAGGRLFRLGDIAHIYRGYVDPPTQKVRYMGQDAIALAVSMAKGGDILTLGKDLGTAFERIKRELPVGIEVHQYSNQPAVVKRSVDEFMMTLLEAVVIVLAVSFFSLGFRTGLVVALSIPLVLAVTFLMMKLYGIDLQRISLGALIISLGLLVDDAIISVEMMATKMEQGLDRVKAASFAYTSTAFPMLTGTLITAAAFMPVGFAKSSAGEYTFSIFAVVTIALLVSWVVAVLFIPYLGYKLLPDMAHGAARPSLFQKFVTPGYGAWRRATFAVPEIRYRAFASCVAAAGSGVRSAGARRRRLSPPVLPPFPRAGELVRGLAQDRHPCDHRGIRAIHVRIPLRAAAVLPVVQPAGTDRRPLASAGGVLPGHRGAGAALRGQAQGRCQHRTLRRLRRQRQPALLPAAGSATGPSEFCAVRDRHQGQQGARNHGRENRPHPRDGILAAARPRQPARERPAGWLSGSVPRGRHRQGASTGSRTAHRLAIRFSSAWSAATSRRCAGSHST